MRLADLGNRICVLGPSGSGKSTLAAAIGELRHLEVVHLDRYRHLPATRWKLRPDEQFARLHDDAIAGERWVMDGNYSALLPHRLERATGVILLDISTAGSLVRYVHRSRGAGQRIGGLEGTKETISWDMIRFILVHTADGRRRRREIFDHLRMPKIILASPSAVEDFYRREGLRRPG